jgi:hypothetical protein
LIRAKFLNVHASDLAKDRPHIAQISVQMGYFYYFGNIKMVAYGYHFELASFDHIKIGCT